MMHLHGEERNWRSRYGSALGFVHTGSMENANSKHFCNMFELQDNVVRISL